LSFRDGTCMNVSLPPALSKELSDQPPRPMTVRGPVLQFPFVAGASGFKVNGREVGYGNCGPRFIFVEEGSVEFKGT